jgi:hypothetical protein
VTVVSCRRAPVDVDASSLSTLREAFADAEPLVLKQAWRESPEPAFRPAVVRVGWQDDRLLILAELDDVDITTAATSHGQRFWELGDTFEIFLAAEGVTQYIECHVTPLNQRLQLRFPLDGPAALDPDPFVKALVPGDDFTSRVWIADDNAAWTVLAAIPATLAGLDRPSLAGSEWRYSFSRYDVTRGATSPVISSTSPHPVPSFHRQQEWGRLVCVG